MHKKKSQYTKGRSMDIAYLFLRHFFQTEYMHYGYWLPQDSVDFLHLKQAQERFVSKLFEMIPADVNTILDVGCGSGKMAQMLIANGFEVDAVAPACMMTNYAKQKLNGKGNIFVGKFEELNITKKYDLVLFSESFQFIPLEKAVATSMQCSNKYIFIADIFKKIIGIKSPIGGGHDYQHFLECAKEKLLNIIENIDVTQYTAPHIDLEQDFVRNFFKPTCQVAKRIYSQHKSRWLRLLIRFLLFYNRKRIKKIQTKYMENKERNNASFMRHKTYRFILAHKIENGLIKSC